MNVCSIKINKTGENRMMAFMYFDHFLMQLYYQNMDRVRVWHVQSYNYVKAVNELRLV